MVSRRQLDSEIRAAKDSPPAQKHKATRKLLAVAEKMLKRTDLDASDLVKIANVVQRCRLNTFAHIAEHRRYRKKEDEREAREAGEPIEDALSDENRREWDLCAGGFDGFVYWCRTYCFVEDKSVRPARPILFRLFRSQEETAYRLFAGESLNILKARQLGFTWLVAAWILWSMIFTKSFIAVVVNQSKPYAAKFLWRVRYMFYRMPRWMRPEVSKKSNDEFGLHGEGEQSVISALAAGDEMGRSTTLDVAVIDEAARVSELKATISAVGPSLDISGGALVLISTAKSAGDEFHEQWKASKTGSNGLSPVFYSWDCRPERTPEWYESTRQKHEHDKFFMAREYPNTPEEAFSAASGRIFPLFAEYEADGTTPRNVRKIELDPNWKRYGAIDWAVKNDPFVFLWMVVIPGPKAFLTFDPSCENSIREMYAYRRSDEHPYKRLTGSDHVPDCTRMAITTLQPRGHLHVYRELYVPEPEPSGFTTLELIDLVSEASGWSKHPAGHWTRTSKIEKFTGIVADRSGTTDIQIFRQFFAQRPCPLVTNVNIRMAAHARGPMADMGDVSGEREVDQGIKWVNFYIKGDSDLKFIGPPRSRSEDLEREVDVPGWKDRLGFGPGSMTTADLMQVRRARLKKLAKNKGHARLGNSRLAV